MNFDNGDESFSFDFDEILQTNDFMMSGTLYGEVLY
jgi:hypothetical protein